MPVNGETTCPSRIDAKTARVDVDGLSSSAFHFAIDGHEFVALENKMWRRRKSAVGGPVCELVVGRIVTPTGRYVIFGDDDTNNPDIPLTKILSRRELQVAMTIAEGRCDKEIARQLGISIYTVREHIRRIFAKLNVSRRAGVIARVLKRPC
jgi:DNA-binding CsgD family transcriptional regulator